MFNGNEMQDLAVYRDYADAYRVCMWLRTKQLASVQAITDFKVTPHVFVGYGIWLWENTNPASFNGRGAYVTKGLLAAAMQRYDEPDDRYVPFMTALPMFREMPKGWMQNGG